MALVTVEGQITTINPQTRTLALKDISGVTHMIRWGQGHDQKMQKQQQWWFCKITGELAEDVITLDVLDFFKKPENWPSNQKSGGGYSGPRTDPVVIARQSMVKVASDIVLSGANADTRPVDVITEDVINIARVLVKFVQEGRL
ncbi:MAG: hypothetical protein M0Q91_13290 [Methanoregula sp.]|jgi:hypothetical protein|nr:hypothetical protein [Methanoregula sp.]